MIVGESRPLIEQAKPASADQTATPQGIGSAPTVLESASPAKSEKTMEPGVFETFVVAIVNFIISMFKSIWACLSRRTPETPLPENAPLQTKAQSNEPPADIAEISSKQ